MSLLSQVRSATDQTRTLAGIGAMNTTLSAGLAAGALLGDRRRGRNLGCKAAFDLILTITGVSLDVVGAKNLDARRPAVFAFNHQSNLDALVCCKLVRHDFTSTGKAEVRRDPAAALTAIALDAVLIERGDPEKAREQMAVAADRLRQGDSVLIAPEGTRNPGPEPGDFRTGVVHLALEAGVPIVPIVLRNTAELMPKYSISPGTVDVCVMPPVETTDWDAADARVHAEHLRDQMAAVIRDWPR